MGAGQPAFGHFDRYVYGDKIACFDRRIINSRPLIQFVLVFSGAGISTSAGLADFRGPRGVWTLEKQQKRKRKRPASSTEPDFAGRKEKSEVDTAKSMDFSRAQPTPTHRAITKLANAGKLKYCITQNVDGLHRRAGLSRDDHCCLHGCAFTEKCKSCFSEFFRDMDVGGMSFRETGNHCDLCGGKLHDTLLDWEDPLPEDDFERAQQECDRADLVLCLGTSLRIEPAGSLPLRAKRFVIVNLQETPKDHDAAMVIKAPVDTVMDSLMRDLGYIDWKDECHPSIERKWTPPLKPSGSESTHSQSRNN